MARPATLYHFTCDHGRRGIGTHGFVTPQAINPLTGFALSWFTTEPAPDREATGLAAVLTTCDRMAYRYVITDLSRCDKWLTSIWRMRTRLDVVDLLEEYATGVQHWWVSDQPVPADLDEAWSTAVIQKRA
jgi:hypothetical protein